MKIARWSLNDWERKGKKLGSDCVVINDDVMPDIDPVSISSNFKIAME
ncbi:MAG: hypothetical protein IPJ86_04850 [Bacteroidetes bacterium]|nr:hypothetical protein [Bacteroidota bacterium]